jgi:hypothetical protein
MDSLVVISNLNKQNLNRRALKVIKSIVSAGTNLLVPLEIQAKLKTINEKELSDVNDYNR